MKSYYINEDGQVVVIKNLSFEAYKMLKQMGYDIVFHV